MIALMLAFVPIVLEVAVRYPSSASAPSGVYLLTHQPLQRNTWVVACLPAEVATFGRRREYLSGGRCPHPAPEGSSEILKRVAALPGDVVQVGTNGITVNGSLLPGTRPLLEDSRGRPLAPAITASGPHQVPPGEVWLYSSFTSKTWDSRYYGGVPLIGVRSSARLLIATR